MFFIIHLLRIMGIEEEIEDILPTEKISLYVDGKLRLFDDFLDFAFLTKTKKIIVVEFKKNRIRTRDLEQLYGYYDRMHCKNKADVLAFLFTIPTGNKIRELKKSCILFQPNIFETKSYDARKILSTIRNKFKDNKMLTSLESSILVTFPLLKTEEDTAKLVKEICSYIQKKKHCIPEEHLEGITMEMYLNIIGHMEEKEHEKLLEMINLDLMAKGLFAQMRKKIREEEEQNIISLLLKNFTPEELSVFLEMDEDEIKTKSGLTN